jgi:hypothetical protein
MSQDHTFAFNELQRANYWHSYTTPNPPLGVFMVQLFAHTGSGDAPYYMHDNAGACIPGMISDIH